MIVELRSKSQITIPKDIVAKLGLSGGDLFEVSEVDGKIILIPVTVYPKKYIAELRAEIVEVKSKITKGELSAFDNVDDLIAELEKE